MTRRVGLLGGTFDPPHRGHVAVARAVRGAMALDEVLFVVAGDPWQKTAEGPVSAPEARVDMVRALVAEEPGLGVDTTEVERAGPSYSVETLEEWHRREPGVELFFIVGSDALVRIPTWKRWQELCHLSTIVVVNRAPHRAAPLPDGLDPERVRQVAMEPVDVSSSMIRAAALRGEPVEDFTGAAVAAVIDRLGLYGGAR